MALPIATVFSAPGAVIGWAALGVAVLMVGLWLLSIRLRDVSIVDPVWGPAFVLVAVIAAATGSGDGSRRWLLAALIAVWGLRLGAHLASRKRGDPEEDRRYQVMRERKGDAFVPWSLVMIFGVQGLLVLIVSLPVQVSAGRPAALGASAIPGVVVFLVGLGFEAIGDEQLRRFKAAPDSKGQVMDRGLWRYTRHPNYFGDFCVWWGLWLVALPAGGTWWTLIGPAVMSTLLIRVSGKALLERDMAKRRPQYAGYIKRTSGFFPLPPQAPRRLTPVARCAVPQCAPVCDAVPHRAGPGRAAPRRAGVPPTSGWQPKRRQFPRYGCQPDPALRRAHAAHTPCDAGAAPGTGQAERGASR